MSEDKTKTVEDDAVVGAEADVEDIEKTDSADAVDKTDETDETDEPDESEAAEVEAGPDSPERGIQWSRVVALVLLPALGLALALGAGYLKWQDGTYRSGAIAADPAGKLSLAEQSVRAARDSTVALLSYTPDKVEQQLGDARNLLTGEFRDSYTQLTTDVVIPGAKEKQISAVASVPAAASVSVDATEAVVLVFVNQTVVVGQSAPTDTASSVRITLEKSGNRWLISKFDPV